MKVFVFDLDFTIWNAGDTWCSETNPPYLWEDRKLLDRSGRWIRLFPETLNVLEFLKKEGKTIVVASRTHQPEWANQLLQLFNIDRYFDIKEIYPGSKKNHLNRIQKQLDLSLNQFVFFDDEDRNIREVSSLGIKSILIMNGITLDIVKKAMKF